MCLGLSWSWESDGIWGGTQVFLRGPGCRLALEEPFRGPISWRSKPSTGTLGGSFGVLLGVPCGLKSERVKGSL